ncbi:glycosyltransferase family 2 protein [Thermodesulfobacteriota bacterium]
MSVSVVLPTYNSDKYIADSIKSILNQTYSELELIVVDDASADDTVKIIQSFQDYRIKLLQNETNIGLAGSLNKGIKNAQGDYIARMDHDDNAFPDRIEKQVNYMRSHPETGVCGTQAITFGAKKRKLSYPTQHSDIMLQMMFRCCMIHPTIMYRKSLLEKYNVSYTEGFPAEDYEIYSRLLKYTKFANLNEPLIKYRIHPEQLSYENYLMDMIPYLRQIKSQVIESLNYVLRANIPDGDYLQMPATKENLIQFANQIRALIEAFHINSLSVDQGFAQKQWLKQCSKIENARFIDKACFMIRHNPCGSIPKLVPHFFK